MNSHVLNEDDHYDDMIDVEALACIDFNNPKSFIMYAGAGSGKTRSLKLLLDNIEDMINEPFTRKGKQVAVITYTKAASNEILRRVGFNSLYHVSTIHSFAWSLIGSYTEDIRAWLYKDITEKCEKLDGKIAVGKTSTKTYKDNVRKREKCRQRLETIQFVKTFVYSPDGSNIEKNSLNHAEVLSICGDFIENYEVLNEILVEKYPILLIDESQDTDKKLMKSFINVQGKYKDRFILGLFGDTMQRIYSQGLENIESHIPDTWIQLDKKMNHRSHQRIVELINIIRNEPMRNQKYRSDKTKGIVRAFITSENSSIKIEDDVCNQMKKITGVKNWGEVDSDYRQLILEHHMAAKRLGFINIYTILSSVSSYKSSLMDGTLSEIIFFDRVFIPILESILLNDDFKLINILDEYSEKLKSLIAKADRNFDKEIAKLVEKAKKIGEFIENDKILDKETIKPLLKYLYDENIVWIPEILISAIEMQCDDTEDDKIIAWINVMDCTVNEMKLLIEYQKENTVFDTHQGVKGLEYEHVMGILHDSESKGFLFKYEKFFGVETLSKIDMSNISSKKDSVISRTRRLLYVVASRAMESLALVIYTSNIEQLKKELIDKEIFDEDEIISL